MSVFEISDSRLTPVKEKRIDLEKDLQLLTEKNLRMIFDLDFVSGSLNREFCVRTAQQDFYIDTLAFDPQVNAFVIIEYKKDKNFSVIDQGYAYLAAMLNNKAEFILEFIERKETLKKPNIDWRQSKVIFVSPEFTGYQRSAIAFKSLPIELWKVTMYQNNTIYYEQIKAPTAKESFDKIAPKGPETTRVAKEIKPYSLDEIFARYKTSNQIRDLFNKIRAEISSLGDDFDEAIGKWTVIYRKQFKTFAYIYPKSKEVYGELRLSEIKMPNRVGYKRRVKESEIFKIAFRIDTEDDLSDAVNLVRQAYENLNLELRS